MKRKLKSFEVPLKRILNTQANTLLARLGHSEWMAQHAKREIWWWMRARVGAATKRRGLLRGRGIVWTGAGRTELLDIEVPLAGPSEVTVQISHTAVSPGTERAQYLALPNASVRFPYRPGYSASGTVISVGRGADHLKPGDRVAIIGGTHASVATVPADRVVRVPDGVDTKAAAMITLGVIARQGLRAADVRPGDSICVLGSGTVGALAQHLAVAAGAESVVAVARSRHQEALARAAGATEFVCLDEGEQPHPRGARVTVDATGDPEALHQAIAATADGGRIVLLGSPRGRTSAFPLREIRSREITLIGAHIGTLQAEQEATGENAFAREANTFLDRLGQDSSFVQHLLSETIDPRDAALLYRNLASGKVRGVVEFDWEGLSSAERVGKARVLRLPDLRAHGLDREHPRPARRQREAGVRSDPSRGDLRVGLLGCGDIGAHNAAAVAAAPNARLVACYDPVGRLAEDVAHKYETQVVPDVESLLERTDVDAVFLSVPHHLHAPLAEAAAAAGKHVIVEKPLANNLTGAKSIVDAARRAGVVLTICFPHRYDLHVQSVRRLIEDGALGDFRGALVEHFVHKPPSYWWGGFSGRSPSNWRASRDSAGGGILIMNLSHYIDLMRFLIGVEPAVVACAAGFEDGMEVEESVSVTVQYRNGAIGCLIGSSAIQGIYKENFFRLWGTDGTVELEPETRAISLRNVSGLAPSRWQRVGTPSQEGSRARFITSFATAIAEGSPPDVGIEDALAAQAFVEAAYRSLEEGHGVSPSDLLTRALAVE